MCEVTMANKLNGRKVFQESHHQGLNCLLEPCLESRHRICFNRHVATESFIQQPCKDSERDRDCQISDKCLMQPQEAQDDIMDPWVEDLQEPCLEPKHMIFLSHSGAQKDFTEQLCKDLERVHHFPFFDKRLDSLPKGEKFPPLILEAAQQCRVAILVLSEEFFTRSKWPMIELNEFVQAQASTNTGLNVLPLFFKISVKQFKDAMRRKCWLKVWHGWAQSDDRIDVQKWELALSKVLSPINGMEYDGGMGEVSYREKVVAAVCKLVGQDVKYDVSHVQSLLRLCEPILRKLDEVELHHRYGVQVVGLFGVGGIGKTTISKALCNELFVDFDGRVCHVELGGKNLTELRWKVVQDLTQVNRAIVPNDADKLVGLLKTRMQRQKVFLCLDNVWEHQIEEARMYLELGYRHGSVVLVTSRSIDVLKSLKLNQNCCLEMPRLEEVDATNLLLYHAAPHETLNDNDWDIIRRCVEACQFSKEGTGGLVVMGQYLPLALKVWGVQLGHISDNPLRWEASLENLKKHKFNHSRQQDHPLFSLLRQGYDALQMEEQHIFLDLAIIVRRVSNSRLLKWLSIMYKKSKDDIEDSLQAIRKKALLQYSMSEAGLEFKIHDLYLEFAEEEAQAGAFDKRRILLQFKGSDVPHELTKRSPSGFWPCLERIGIHSSKMQSLRKASLHLCKNVEFLQLSFCDQLVELDVRGMDSLAWLDISDCEKLGDKFEGVEELHVLVWFRWEDMVEPAPFLRDLSSLTALQVLDLEGFARLSELYYPPNLSGCINLRELTLSKHPKLASFPDLSKLSRLEAINFTWCRKATGFPDLSNLSRLRKINFGYCENATRVIGLSSLTNLKDLNLYFCYSLQELPCLGDLIALESLNVGLCTKLSVLKDLRMLENLQDLCVESCRNLTSLAGLLGLTSLRHLDATGCTNLRELPDLSNLKELRKVKFSHSSVSIVPKDFGRLAGHRILEMRGCLNLVEPLVMLLMEHERQVPEGRHGSISNGFYITEITTDNLWCDMKKDVVHYMNEVFSSLGEFDRKKFLIGARILGEFEGGIDFVIRALCEHSDMGILSMVVAKYAARGDYWEQLTAKSTIQPLSRGILHYLDVQVEQVQALLSSSNDGRLGGYSSVIYSLNRVLFIFQHMTVNRAMTAALGSDEICTATQICIRCLEQAPDSQYGLSKQTKKELLEEFGNILDRCKAADACPL